MKMKITILEDSVIESERLKNGIRKYGQQYDWDIEIDEYESGEEYFSKNSEGTTIQASAFFLDIQMGQMNGIEVAKRLRESGYQGIIVFLTAFREYVFRGYEVRALNYLLKPVKENTLFLCLDEIAKELSNNTYIYRNKQEIVSIPYADILTFSSRLHYVDILTVDGKCYEQMSTLNKIIVHLPSEFIRTHRSYIVNMAHIYRITSGTIELSNHLTTQIARSYSKDVISAFAKYTTRFDTSGDFECFCGSIRNIHIWLRMFFEYFYNHSVIVRMGSFITYTRLYPNLGNYLFIVTTLYRRCPCSNAVNMYLRQLFSRLS